ncbi:MAG: hypothetical protein JO336_20890 [Acidobacteriia bacterium]|nr:hypothetical protein [Terriglobia bacterium]MBV8906594.1 hypothetical protein [Terriglobia bacterium]
MATLRQVEANRQNALKSTGPITAQGKETVSGNSIRHGLRSRKVILKGEDPAEFDQLAGDLESEWQPHSPTERHYLLQMVIAQWKLVRVEVAEANLYDEPQSAREQIVLLDRIWQAQQRFERSFSRAQRELERLQHSRSHAEPPASTESPAATHETVPDPAGSKPRAQPPEEPPQMPADTTTGPIPVMAPAAPPLGSASTVVAPCTRTIGNELTAWQVPPKPEVPSADRCPKLVATEAAPQIAR